MGICRTVDRFLTAAYVERLVRNSGGLADFGPILVGLFHIPLDVEDPEGTAVPLIEIGFVSAKVKGAGSVAALYSLAMPKAQKPPYCGTNLAEFETKASRCEAAAKYKIDPSYSACNSGDPFIRFISIMLGTGSYPPMATPSFSKYSPGKAGQTCLNSKTTATSAMW